MAAQHEQAAHDVVAFKANAESSVAAGCFICGRTKSDKSWGSLLHHVMTRHAKETTDLKLSKLYELGHPERLQIQREFRAANKKPEGYFSKRAKTQPQTLNPRRGRSSRNVTSANPWIGHLRGGNRSSKQSLDEGDVLGPMRSRRKGTTSTRMLGACTRRTAAAR